MIVSDNCSQDGTGDAARRIADDRVTSLDTGERLTMTDNWEFALRHARGRYVLFVGDDDAIRITSSGSWMIGRPIQLNV